jgi:hypothetical protein
MRRNRGAGESYRMNRLEVPAGLIVELSGFLNRVRKFDSCRGI